MIDQTSRWFDESNPNWSATDDINETFLRTKQHYVNHLLQAKGHLLLNDVYHELGFEPTAPGSVLGWSVMVNKDSFIEFDFIRMEAGYAIDFNIDGVVFHEIGKAP